MFCCYQTVRSCDPSAAPEMWLPATSYVHYVCTVSGMVPSAHELIVQFSERSRIAKDQCRFDTLENLCWLRLAYKSIIQTLSNYVAIPNLREFCYKKEKKQLNMRVTLLLIIHMIFVLHPSLLYPRLEKEKTRYYTKPGRPVLPCPAPLRQDKTSKEEMW